MVKLSVKRGLFNIYERNLWCYWFVTVSKFFWHGRVFKTDLRFVGDTKICFFWLIDFNSKIKRQSGEEITVFSF